MTASSPLDGYRLVEDYFGMIAGRKNCDDDAERIVESLNKEEQKRVISNMLMAIMHKSREADRRACPMLAAQGGHLCKYSNIVK